MSLSCTHLTRILNLSHSILHISNFHYEFHNQIATVPKPVRVILCMFSKFIRFLYFISHTSRTYLTHILHSSRTFQTFTMSFTIKLLPFIIHLEWFYVCLVSLLGPCVLSRTHLAPISHTLFFIVLWMKNGKGRKRKQEVLWK